VINFGWHAKLYSKLDKSWTRSLLFNCCCFASKTADPEEIKTRSTVASGRYLKVSEVSVVSVDVGQLHNLPKIRC